METIDTNKQIETAENQVVIDDPNFNEEEFYDKELKPIIEQLHAKCRERNIPVLLCIEYSRTSDGKGKDTTGGSRMAVLPGARTSPRLRMQEMISEKGPEALIPAILGGLLGK